jgi:hypothetical protein
MKNETVAQLLASHCERSEAISQHVDNPQDCRGTSCLAMTKIEQKGAFCKGLKHVAVN